jgi:hypothetical protein
MRHVICASCTLLCGILSALYGADLTVILQFDASHSLRAASTMQLEAERLLKDSGVSLDWRISNQLSPYESFPRLAVVKMRGRCEMTGILVGAGEAEVLLGVTYKSDGHVIPFSEVKCDAVRATLAAAHLPSNPEVRDLLFGRALGRVLAHELQHVLNRSGTHTESGVTQKYLSAARLIGDHID